MAGALAAAIILEGEGGPPAAGPAGGGGGQGAGTTGTVDFAQRQQEPPAQDPTVQEPSPPVQKPPVRTGDVRASPLPGTAAAPPPGAQTFYTMADLAEFVDSGAARSPAAALAARFPAGGSVVDIMTGGMAELDGASPGMRLEDAGGRMPAEMPGGPIAEGPADAWPQADSAMAGEDGGGFAAAPAEADAPAPAMAPPPSPGHSTTNVQAEGVDEPDFVKNDARHIYILDGGELTIVDALPADTVRVLSGGSAGEVRDSYRPGDASIAFRGPVGPPPGEHRYDNMFLDGDSLVVVYEARQWASVPLDPADPSRTIAVRLPSTHVMWVDIADKSAPEPAGEYAVDGEYGTARMIDGTVYLVTRTGLEAGQAAQGLPALRHTALEDGRPGVPCRGPSDGPSPQAPECSAAPLVPPAHYLAPVEGEAALTTVSALPPPGGGPAKPAAQTYLLGGGDIAYVSPNAAYLALPRAAPGAAEVLEGLRETGLLRAMVEPIGVQWREEALAAASDAATTPAARLEAVLSAVESGYDGMDPAGRAAALQALEEAAWSRHYAAVPPEPRTDVHRIEIGAAPGGGGPAVSYAGAGTVRGEPLDRFSLDEHNGRLRIATEVRDGIDPPHTAVHILDAGTMAVESSLEGIAPGESMESARFAGGTLFLVTFLQVDPFFVVDVSGDVPAILGELKVPGFSTYLQPHGPDMVLGVGTYVSEGVDEPGRDWAVKVSLYDVSDYAMPLLADEAVIEGSAWSPAQSSHRALLADAGRGIVALPVVFDWGGPDASGAAGTDAQPRDGAGGWTGFYAFRTDAAERSLGAAHAVRHGAAADGAPPEGRSLYIADWLYTIYDGVLAISHLDDPGRLVKSIDLAGS